MPLKIQPILAHINSLEEGEQSMYAALGLKNLFTVGLQRAAATELL